MYIRYSIHELKRSIKKKKAIKFFIELKQHKRTGRINEVCTENKQRVLSIYNLFFILCKNNFLVIIIVLQSQILTF